MIKDFEYLYRRENNIIIKGINDEDLTSLFISIVLEMTDGINDWQREYIYKDDDAHYANGDKTITPILLKKSWNETTGDKEIDLRREDLAFVLKLLEYRLLKTGYSFDRLIIKDSSKKQSFTKLIGFIRRDMRNLSSHSSLSDLEEIFTDNQSIYNMLLNLRRLMKNTINDCEDYLVRGTQVMRVLSTYIDEQLSPIINAYYKAKIGDVIAYQNNEEVTIEDLATYNVLVDYSVFLQEDGYKAVDSLIVKGKTIFAEQSLLARLETTQMQGATSNKEKAKDVIRTLEMWVEHRKLILLENANVVEKLGQVKNAKWCVITQDYDLANQVWDLSKENVIALKTKGRKAFQIFKIEKEVHTREFTPTSKFKVEFDMDSTETNIEEIKYTTDSPLEPVVESRPDWDTEPRFNSYVEPIHKNVVQPILDPVVEITPEPSDYYDDKADFKTEGNKEKYKFNNKRILTTKWEVYVGTPDQDCKDVLSTAIGDGGEGSIYKYESNGTEYAKIYKSGQLTQLKAEKIESMVECKDDIPSEVCWPQDILCHPHHKKEKVIVGYSMLKAGKDGKKTLGTVRQVMMRIVKGEYQWERKDLVRLCYNCAMLFGKLHKKDILMGDVNPDNIMVDENKSVYFIDTDSYQFGKYNCPVGTVEFSSPELLKKMDKKKLGYEYVRRNIEDEYFAVTVLYFYILFLQEYPYSIDANTSAKECIIRHWFRFEKGKEIKRNYIWKNLTTKLQQMFRDTFVDGKRYPDDAWIRAFNNMLQMKDYVSDTFERELSNEIFPYSAVENEGETWEKLSCRLCNISYMMARVPRTPLGPEEKYCPRCKEIKKMAQKRIYKLNCPKCKELWTINEWDIDGRDIDSLCCPDCDDAFYFSKKTELKEKENNTKEYKEKIELQMSYALKRYREG